VTVPSTLDAAGWQRNHLDGDDGGTDLAWAMVHVFAEALTSAETSLHQAGYGGRTEERTNSRNGYRDRRWDTRVGRLRK
jgi:putative transposase